MTDPLERAAMAIGSGWLQEGTPQLDEERWLRLSDHTRQMLRNEARMAIAAIREPSEAMLEAAREWSRAKYGKPIGHADARGCWQAMINALLAPFDQPGRRICPGCGKLPLLCDRPFRSKECIVRPE